MKINDPDINRICLLDSIPKLTYALFEVCIYNFMGWSLLKLYASVCIIFIKIYIFWKVLLQKTNDMYYHLYIENIYFNSSNIHCWFFGVFFFFNSFRGECSSLRKIGCRNSKSDAILFMLMLLEWYFCLWFSSPCQ